MRFAVLLMLAVSVLPYATPGHAGENGDVPLLRPHYTFDRDTLLRGAKLFVSHCLTCHNLKYLRYSRVGDDLGLTKDEVESMLMTPNGAEFNKGMLTTMNPDDAADWFGTAPPDLTLEARYRGTRWIYTYLKSFYLDPDQPLGWNNRLFPRVAMPNVLASLSGVRDAQGNVIDRGSMTPRQFDQAAADLTAWLQYTSDPSRLLRDALGPWVIGFLVIFSLLAYWLKCAYWRDVH
jgi:ubiquinol-cytochrome c reductase cytochrome c1 subunit